MEKPHPYISGASNISQMIERLRNNFPTSVTSETVKSYGLAPNNESSVINALQFIGIIDADGKQNSDKNEVFLFSRDEDFQKGFSDIVKTAYNKLFDLHGDNAWTLDDASLVSFFRTNDKTSNIIGIRQARVFRMFSALSGKIEQPAQRTKKRLENTNKSTSSKPISKASLNKKETPIKKSSSSIVDHLGMSIKIDVNLPSDASKETYDNIFKSIREHLIDG